MPRKDQNLNNRLIFLQILNICLKRVFNFAAQILQYL